MSDTVTVYMIENTTTGKFWTNNGFKADHGNLYKNTKFAQQQIENGKLRGFIIHGLDDATEDNVKISKFTLTRAGEDNE